MTTIRMVSNEEGERLRKEEAARQESIRQRLVGATVTDLRFHGIGITGATIQEMTLEKDGTAFSVEIEADTYYGSIISRLAITDLTTRRELE